LLAGKTFDLLYLDPPYNKRNYAAYYHLPETLAGLKPVRLNGSSLSGQPKAVDQRGTNIRNAAGLAYNEELIKAVDWKTLILHYCDKSLIPLQDLRTMLRRYGKVREETINALGYTNQPGSRSILHNVFVVTKNGC
jgi:adenine-specific DNA-methyltransferase